MQLPDEVQDAVDELLLRLERVPPVPTDEALETIQRWCEEMLDEAGLWAGSDEQFRGFHPASYPHEWSDRELRAGGWVEEDEPIADTARVEFMERMVHDLLAGEGDADFADFIVEQAR